MVRTTASSRVTREAIGEGSFYVPLARRSHEIWRELEAATGDKMLFEVGCLYIGKDGDPEEAFGRPGVYGDDSASGSRPRHSA